MFARLSDIALDKTKQARAYELIKDPDKHAEIIALCEKDPSVEIAIVGIVNLLRGGKELEEFAENGLTNIIVGRAENEPLPAFNDLPSKVKYLLANLLDVKKFAALANHPSENTSLATVFTVPFDDVDPVDERIVTHLLFRVAFREANAYGTSLKGFEDACSKIFREDSKYYKTAYECVTKDAREAQVEIVEGLNADIPAALDNTWLDDTIEKFLTTVLTLNAAQEQANNDEASANSQATYYNKMQTATKSTLIKYCALNNRPEEVIELNTKIFKV